MEGVTMTSGADAEQAFDDGMERWWQGDRTGACRLFKRALTHAPDHADAHVHLGICAFDKGKLAEAERHYRCAVASAERDLVREDDEVPWGHVDNRPYLRALYNLALVHRRRCDFEAARLVHEDLLRMNPNDNQGVRYLLSEEHHRGGDLTRAIRMYEDSLEEPGSCFGLALALHQGGRPQSEVGRALLRGFAANRYLAPILLGEPWQALDAFHGTSMAEPEWAADHVAQARDLWSTVPRSVEVLRFWWRSPLVRSWRAKLDDLMVALKDLPPGDRRDAVVSEHLILRSEAHIDGLAGEVGRSS